MFFHQIYVQTPVEHLSSGKLVSEEKFIHPSRILDNNVLLIGLQGRLILSIEETEYELTPGTALILPARKRHWGIKQTSGISYYWTHFSFLPDTYRILSDIEAIEAFNLLAQGMYMQNTDFYLIPEYFTLLSPERINVFFHQLLHYSSYPAYSNLASKYTLNMILTELTQQAMESYHNKLNNKNSHRFSNVLEWIRANYNKNLMIQEVADRFGYNPNYISNKIAAKTGLSFKQFQNKLRLEQAKLLLTNTDFSIKEISFQIGFQDEKYFMRLFKQHEDITPTEYRNSFFETHMNIK